MRRDCFLRAYAELYDFASQLEIANEVLDIDNDAFKFWIALVRQEIKLVKGVMESDKRRFKNLL